MRSKKRTQALILLIVVEALIVCGRTGKCAPPDEKCLAEFANWGVGQTSAITQTGEFLVFSRGASLEIATVDHSGVIDTIGRIEMPARIQDLEIKGDYLFAASGEFGLRVINISIPSAPVEVGFFETENWATAVAIHDDMVVVVDYWEGIRVLAVDDPSSPVEVYAYEERHITDVVADSNLIFAIDKENTVTVFARSSFFRLHPITSFETETDASNLELSGDLFFYTALDLNTYYNQLHIVDVSNPWQPTTLGRLSLGIDVDHLIVDGDIAYTAEAGVIGQQDGVRLIDVSDPSYPRQVGFLNAISTSALFASSNRAYIGVWPGRMKILDVEDPSTPIELNDVPVGNNIGPVALNGKYLYVLDRDLGFWILDTSRPGSPRQVGFVPTDVGSSSIVADSGVVIVTSRTGLTVFDATEPTTPVKVSSVPRPAYPQEFCEVKLASGCAFVAVSGTDGGLAVFDVSVPSEVRDIAFLGGMPSGASAVILEGDVAFAIEASKGVHIIDIQEPEEPLEIGYISASPTDGVQGLTVHGNTAYMYSRNGSGFGRVIDVSYPRAPVEVGVVDWVDDHIGASISGDALYVLDWWLGVRVIDLSDPSAPIEVQLIEVPQGVGAITSVDDRVFVSDWGERLKFFGQCPRPNVPDDRDDTRSYLD